MNLSRRKLLRMTASAAVLPCLSDVAKAQVYPSRRCEFSSVSSGRCCRHHHSDHGTVVIRSIGQAFVIENRPGAANQRIYTGSFNVAADGYSMVYIGTTVANQCNSV